MTREKPSVAKECSTTRTPTPRSGREHPGKYPDEQCTTLSNERVTLTSLSLSSKFYRRYHKNIGLESSHNYSGGVGVPLP